MASERGARGGRAGADTPAGPDGRDGRDVGNGGDAANGSGAANTPGAANGRDSLDVPGAVNDRDATTAADGPNGPNAPDASVPPSTHGEHDLSGPEEDLLRRLGWTGHGVMRDGVLHLPANALGSVNWPATWPGRTRFGAQMAYLLAGLPVAIVTFVVVLVGLVLGAGTLVIWIGLPIVVGTLAAARGFAAQERRVTEAVTGRPLPPHHYRPPRVRADGGRRRRIGDLTLRLLHGLADPQSWRDLAHAVAGLPVRLVCAVVALVWAVVGLGGLLYVFWQWSLPRGDGNWTLFSSVTGVHSTLGDVALNTGLGVLLLGTLPTVVRWLVDVRALLARGLLTNQTAALRARAQQLAAARRAAVAAEAQTLRRLERDIHDGPQQRLVRLGMDLEAAVRRLDDDPERARPLLAEALEQSREALDELRALSRGIAPPILADRGLGPALAAAAARSPVRVSLDVGLDDGARLPALVENTAYFVVTEALTNVAKHARAEFATVTVAATGDTLVVTVTDDGVGGAHQGKGHGLAGLADRLEIVEGSIGVSSPPGGPTVISARIPVVGLGEA